MSATSAYCAFARACARLYGSSASDDEGRNALSPAISKYGLLREMFERCAAGLRFCHSVSMNSHRFENGTGFGIPSVRRRFPTRASVCVPILYVRLGSSNPFGGEAKLVPSNLPRLRELNGGGNSLGSRPLANSEYLSSLIALIPPYSREGTRSDLGKRVTRLTSRVVEGCCSGIHHQTTGGASWVKSSTSSL